MSDAPIRGGYDPVAGHAQRPGEAPRGWDLPGFGPMTRITTQMGDFPAQTLRVGDRVRTRRGAFMRIVWLDRVVLDEEFLAHHPEAQPILIRSGALGAGMPARDVVVSPGQRIHVQRMQPGARPEPAGRLAGGPRIMRKPESIFTYTLFHCGELVEVHVEGLWIPIAPRAPRTVEED